jgi:hypothetical protein
MKHHQLFTLACVLATALSRARAMTDAAAYATLLTDIQQFVVDRYQLVFESSVPRTRCTALVFRVPLNHFVVEDLVEDIFKATSGVRVRTEIDGTTSKLALLVPQSRAVAWRCCERYSRPQIITFVAAGFIVATVLLSAPALLYRLYAT